MELDFSPIQICNVANIVWYDIAVGKSWQYNLGSGILLKTLVLIIICQKLSPLRFVIGRIHIPIAACLIQLSCIVGSALSSGVLEQSNHIYAIHEDISS